MCEVSAAAGTVWRGSQRHLCVSLVHSKIPLSLKCENLLKEEGLKNGWSAKRRKELGS